MDEVMLGFLMGVGGALVVFIMSTWNYVWIHKREEEAIMMLRDKGYKFWWERK